ncbi:MAG: heme exporter protein B [Myxococcota bacterium]|jgi:heme exporter protein B
MSSVLHQIMGVLYKDLLIEWRAPSRIFALLCFALTTLLLFGFAIGPSTDILRRHAGGYLWLSILFSSTALLSRSMQVEEESGASDSLLLAPTRPAAIFYGKALANTAQLVVLGVAALPVTLVLCDASVTESWTMLAASIVLGTAALAAPGTMYAALTARISGQQLLMPLLLFPLVVPALLAAVKSTSLALLGDAMGQSSSWLQLLLFFNIIYWSLCGVLFGRVVES